MRERSDPKAQGPPREGGKVQSERTMPIFPVRFETNGVDATQPSHASGAAAAREQPSGLLGRLSRDHVKKLGGLALGLVILGAVVGLVGALLWPKTYAARSDILFPITQEQPTGFLREDRSMTTQLVLLESESILAPVAAGQDRSVEDLREDVSAEVAETSELIRLEVRAGSREEASRTAQAIINEYIAFSTESQPHSLRAFLSAELGRAGTAVADARGQLAAARASGTSSEINEAEANLQGALQREQEVRTHLETLDTVIAGPQPLVLAPPYPVDDPVSPRPLFATAAGALVGLVVAAGTVGFLARRWTRK